MGKNTPPSVYCEAMRRLRPEPPDEERFGVQASGNQPAEKGKVRSDLPCGRGVSRFLEPSPRTRPFPNVPP